MTPLHNVCNLDPRKIAERGNNFSEMKTKEKEEATKEALDLKVCS